MRNCASQMTNLEIFRKPLNVIASGAKQSSATQEDWIASLQELLARTVETSWQNASVVRYRGREYGIQACAKWRVLDSRGCFPSVVFSFNWLIPPRFPA
jgi:hypothetical protein